MYVHVHCCEAKACYTYGRVHYPSSVVIHIFHPSNTLFIPAVSLPSGESNTSFIPAVSLPSGESNTSFIPAVSLPSGEDETVREKAIEYVSTSLMSMRHKLFLTNPDNEKHLLTLIKKVCDSSLILRYSLQWTVVSSLDTHYSGQ